MATHTNIGDATIIVGSYDKGGETKKRYRKIGILMKTVEDDGEERFWLKLNADALSPSLLILTRASMLKGEDQVSVNIFAQQEEGTRAEREPAEDIFAK